MLRAATRLCSRRASVKRHSSNLHAHTQKVSGAELPSHLWFVFMLGYLLQALSVAPRVATLWYLYCETATQCLSLEECREIFQEAFRLTHRYACQILSSLLLQRVLCLVCEQRFGSTRWLLLGKPF